MSDNSQELLPQERLSEIEKTVYREIMSQREQILRAFVAKTGFQPDEVEQVVQNEGNEVTWFIRRHTAPTAAVKHPAMLALESLTPGGSEYAGDIQRCVDHIRERLYSSHDRLVAEVKRRKAAESAAAVPDSVRRDAEELNLELRRRLSIAEKGWADALESLRAHPAPAVGLDALSERKAFEKWWPTVGQTIGKASAWIAWQTRAALSSLPSQPAPVVGEDEEKCENCSKIIPMGKGKIDAEGIPLCDACYEELIKEAARPPARPSCG